MPQDPTGVAAAALADLVGPEYSGDLIRNGAAALASSYPAGIPSATTAEELVATVLAGAMSGLTKQEIAGGLLEGAEEAVRDAELATLAATLRAAYKAAAATPDPLDGLVRFADAAGVDLETSAPAPSVNPTDLDVDALAVVIAEARLAGIRAGEYTLARVILEAGYSRAVAGELEVRTHNTDGTTAYRFAAPGVLLSGRPTVTLVGDEWHLEEQDGAETVRAVGEDEVGAILALVAARQGLVAIFGPADGRPPVPLDARNDPAFQIALKAVSESAAAAGRFLSLTDREAIAGAVYQDLRAAGAIK